MVTATLTSKGQLTIPKSVRDVLRLRAGDRVTFVVHDTEAVMKPVSKSVDAVFGSLHRPGMSKRSVEEMDAAVAKHLGKAAR